MTDTLTQEQIDSIVPAGLDFIRALTESLGADLGMELFNNMTRTLPQSVAGEIMFAMLTGKYQGGTVVLRTFQEYRAPENWKIPAIKCVRAYTGLGLKEAKDIVEAVQAGIPQKVTITRSEAISNGNARLNFVKEIRDLGFEVS